ncbi:MAG: hypothetical protein Kow0031_24190 [Anaerolineae bacterium]
MAVDFDFDTDYNDEEPNEPEEVVEEDVELEEEDEEEEESKSSSPLRTILLALVILLLLCVVCFVGGRFLNLPIPGMGGSAPPPPPPVEEPAPEGDAAVGAEATEGEAAVEGEGDAMTGEATEGEGEAAVEGEGDAMAGEATEGEGEAAVEGEGDAMAGEATEGEGEAAVEGEGDAMAGEATEGEAAAPAEGEAAEGEGDAMAGEATEGEAAAPAEGEGDAMAGEATEGEAAEEDIIIDLEPEAGEDVAVAVPIVPCDDPAANTPPVADAGGSYEAMMGKGTAIVNFDGSNSTDDDGAIVNWEWDFGDGELGEGIVVQHGYGMTGTHIATLTVTDNCTTTATATATVTIVPAQPPTDGDGTDGDGTDGDGTDGDGTDGDGGTTPPPPAIDPSLGTGGFCYQVQRGDTLWGIATSFGVTVPDLAYVNGVSTEYYVIAGQGLFVPTGPINTSGPNIYAAQAGDTVTSIAAQCGVSAYELAVGNGLTTDSVLSPGQLIRIPPPWSY